jgi:Tol biopolymer transport system component
MRRAVAVAAWIVAARLLTWAGAREAPCDAAGRPVARQQLGGRPTGLASADISADGRLVAFVSQRRLTADDGNAVEDVYTLDRTSGRIALESVPARPGGGEGSSTAPRLSADGRFVVFSTLAASVIGVPIEADGGQVLRRDRLTGTVTLVSRTPAGVPGNGWSGYGDVSADGRHVVFESRATDLVSGPDANRTGSDVYLFDAADGAVQRVSVGDAGVQSASGESSAPAISGTGRFVVFASTAPLDASARAQPHRPVRSVFRRDLVASDIRRLSATPRGGVPDGASFQPAISGDGRRTVFVSIATNLDGGERRTRGPQLYLHDADAAGPRLISRNRAGRPADGSSRHPALSSGGRFVVFTTDASDLPCLDRCGPLPDVNLVADVYRLDLVTGAVDRVSGGAGTRDAWWTASTGATVDATGRVIAFSSRQPVDEADLEDDDDLYVAVLPGAGDAGATAGSPPCRPLPPRDRAGVP